MRPEAEIEAILSWLYARQRFGIRPGLERTAALLRHLGEPQRNFDSVLVGGTNGKGSTVATLASVLRAAGRRVGRFVSPHLTSLNERIVLNGEPVTPPLLVAQLAELQAVADRSGATFFEVLFAACCRLFADADVEVAVIEVGLGGRYDATNTLSPLLSIVTNVGLDHGAVLGDTVEAIAADKAHILRPGRPALTGARGAALRVIEAHASAVQAPLTVLRRDIAVAAVSRGWQGSRVTVGFGSREIEVATPLLGRHQQENVALAVAAADAVGVPLEAQRLGVAQTVWPGRLEVLDWRGRRLLLDGAHNPAAARALAVALADLAVQPLAFVVGVSRDKDVDGIVAALAPLAALLVAAQATYAPRSIAAQELAERIGASAWQADPALALDLAASANPDATLVVAGSLFLVAEVRTLALGGEPETTLRWQ